MDSPPNPTRVTSTQVARTYQGIAWEFQCGLEELRSCVKVEVAVLGFPSLKVPTVSVDVKRH